MGDVKGDPRVLDYDTTRHVQGDTRISDYSSHENISTFTFCASANAMLSKVLASVGL